MKFITYYLLMTKPKMLDIMNTGTTNNTAYCFEEIMQHCHISYESGITDRNLMATKTRP